MKKREIALEEIKYAAIIHASAYLTETKNLSLSPELFSRYIERNPVNKKAGEIQKDPRLQRLKSPEKQIDFFIKELSNYIIDSKPFNEKGKRLLDSSLEGIVERPNMFQRFFSTQKGREKQQQRYEKYVKQKQTVREISDAVSSKPELYSKKSPELVEAVRESKERNGRGALAEILYSSKEISKEAYSKIKSGIRESSEKILDLAKQYISNPATSYATIILGLVLIFLFNPIRTTGATVGVSTKSSSLSLVGIGLLFIGILSFVFRSKNNGKKY